MFVWIYRVWVQFPLGRVKNADTEAKRWVLPLKAQCLQNSAETGPLSAYPAICGIQVYESYDKSKITRNMKHFVEQ